MASGGRTLTVYLAADTKRAQSALGGFSSKLSSFAKGLGIAAVAAGVYALGKAVDASVQYLGDAVKAAEEAATANARLDQVLSQMGYADASQRLKDYADAMSLTIAVEDEQIKAVQAKLATFGELTKTVDDAGGAFDRATQAAFDLAATGFGTAESNAVQLGKALQDPVKGLTSLGRAGVTFTDAEKERIKTLVESNKIGEAQALVLDAIEKQVGGTAEATANASDKMAVAWGEIQEQIGTALLPVFEDVTAFVIDELLPAFDRWWSDVGPKVTAAIEDLWEWITDSLLPALSDLWDAFTNNIIPVVSDLWDALSDTVDILSDLVDGFTDSGDAGDDAADSWQWLVTLVNFAADRLAWMKFQLDLNNAALRKVAEVMQPFIMGLRLVWEWLEDVATSISNFILQLSSIDLWDVGRQIIDGLLGGLKSAWDGVISWAQSAASSFTSIFTGSFRIQSPSRVFMEIGGNIVDGFAIGLEGLDKVTDDVKNKLEDLVDKSVDRLDKLAERARTALDDARAALRDYRDELLDAIQSEVSLRDAWDTATAENSSTSLVDALRQQVGDAQYFASTLEELADSGASQALIDQVAAMGPAAGLALADEILTGGLIPELNKLLRQGAVIGKPETKLIADAFYGPGVESALQLMAGLGDAIAKETKRLRKLGAKLGVELSIGMIEQLQKALARFESQSRSSSSSSSARSAAAPIVLQVDGRTLGTVVVEQLQAYTATNGAVRGVRLAS